MNFQNNYGNPVRVRVFQAGREDDPQFVAQHTVVAGANQAIPLAPGTYYVEVTAPPPVAGVPEPMPTAVLNSVNANALVTCAFVGGELTLN
jgi:hypothetical protein